MFFEAHVHTESQYVEFGSAIFPNAWRKDQQSVNHGDWIHETVCVTFDRRSRCKQTNERYGMSYELLCRSVNAALQFTLLRSSRQY